MEMGQNWQCVALSLDKPAIFSTPSVTVGQHFCWCALKCPCCAPCTIAYLQKGCYL